MPIGNLSALHIVFMAASEAAFIGMEDGGGSP
jgi:hypothetical protein